MDDANLTVMVLKQRPALQIADGYARVWQDLETNINVKREQWTGW